MIKFFVTFLVCLICASSLKADDVPILISGQLKAKWEHLKEDFLKIELKGTALYAHENLTVVGEVKTHTCIHKYYEHIGLDIEKAYFDYKIADKLICTIGRDSMENVFESKLQSGSKFNGVMVTAAYEGFSLRGGGLALGEQDMFGAFSQIHVKLLDMPVLISYGLTYWGTQPSAVGISKEFLISQITYKYFFDQKVLGQPLEFIGGFVLNHKASLAQKGWYVGYSWGTPIPQHMNEWKVGLSYQNVDIFAIPAHDMNGIGQGRAARGVVIEGTYTFTDHLAIQAKTELATLSRRAADKQNYTEFAALCKF